MKPTESNGSKLSNFFMNPSKAAMDHFIDSDQIFYDTAHFHHMLQIERKRTGRSEKPFVLMLLDLSELQTRQHNTQIFEIIKEILVSCSRETDIRGWYEHDRIMGAIFTEMDSVDKRSIEKISRKIDSKISNTLNAAWAKKIRITHHIFGFPVPEKDRGLTVTGIKL